MPGAIWSPVTATYDDLLDFFRYMTVEHMQRFYDVAIELEEYLYAEKLTRIMEYKRLHPESIVPLAIKFHTWDELQ